MKIGKSRSMSGNNCMKKVFCGGDDGVGRRRKGGCTL